MVPLRCCWSILSKKSHRYAAVCYSTKTKRTEHAEKIARYSHEYPEKMLNKKQKIPSHMYVANSDIAEVIAKHIDPYVRERSYETVLEVNPGLCHFTRQLLDRESQFRKIILIENIDYFMPRLHELHALYPERVKVRQGDFVGLGKLTFMDKMDNGTRVAELLHDVPQRSFSDDINMLVFGAVGSYNFFKYLLSSLIFQIGLYNLGRCEMILAVPPPIYIHLTCSNEIGYLVYRSSSVLFQILFEHQFIAKVPRNEFLPTQTDYTTNQNSKLRKVKSINPEFLYLVKFVPRRNLHELCHAEDLPALWFFIKQNFISRRNRIIPNLEKIVPGCGPRLIINSENYIPVTPLYPDDSSKMPQFSTLSTSMSTQNFHPNINIYTQFGDLSPSEVLTVFTQFRQWPEYTESSFLASLENTLLKLEASTDEQNIEDSINLNEEDDISGESVDDLLVTTEELTSKLTKPTKSRKKSKSTDQEDVV